MGRGWFSAVNRIMRHNTLRCAMLLALCALVFLLRSGVVGSLIVMASIEDLWSQFSLIEEEENGADVPRKTEVSIVRLAAKFFTK